MERDLNGREAAAALLILAVVGRWVYLAASAPTAGEAAAWAAGALVLVLAGAGVVRRNARMILALRRSARMLTVMLALLLVIPLELADTGRPASLGQRLAELLPPLVICALLSLLLEPPAPEPPAKAPESGPTSRKRRRTKKRSGKSR